MIDSTEPKYILFPGTIVSKSDGDVHVVGAYELARLYGVDMRDCRIVGPIYGYKGYIKPKGAIELHPRRDGNYTLPKQ